MVFSDSCQMEAQSQHSLLKYVYKKRLCKSKHLGGKKN